MGGSRVKVVVAGAAGKMGARISDVVCQDDGTELFGAFERSDHPDVGKRLGDVIGLAAADVTLAPGLGEVIDGAMVVVDFTSPGPTLANAEIAAQKGVALVIGTTGLNADQNRRLAELAEKTPIVYAPNMSLGVNLMFKLVGEAAKALGDGFDIEVWEAHHRLKKDAPSGTAVKLYEKLCQATGRDTESAGVYGRQGLVGRRTDNEIGMQVIRGGDIVGEHTVLFAGLGERFEITHRAHSRDTFARGAVRAVKWIAGKGPGLYDMADVLGLK